MSKGQTFQTDILKLIFQNIAIALVGDASGPQPSAVAGNLYVSLHTANPGETGDQTSSEAAYTGYARVAVVRSTGGWSVTSASPSRASNVSAVNFPAATGGSETETYFAVGTASTGTGKLLYSGPIDTPLAVSSGITPSFAAGNVGFTED